MPINSRYSTQKFDALSQDILLAIETHQADRDLSLMVLGNVLSNIFHQQTSPENRQQMVSQFCDILTKSTK